MKFGTSPTGMVGFAHQEYRICMKIVWGGAKYANHTIFPDGRVFSTAQKINKNSKLNS